MNDASESWASDTCPDLVGLDPSTVIVRSWAVFEEMSSKMVRPRYAFRFSEGFDLVALVGTMCVEIDEICGFAEIESDDDSEESIISAAVPSRRIGYRELVGDLAPPRSAGVSTVSVAFWFEQLDDSGPTFNWRKSSSFRKSSLLGVLELLLEELVAVIRPHVEVDVSQRTVVLDIYGKGKNSRASHSTLGWELLVLTSLV